MSARMNLKHIAACTVIAAVLCSGTTQAAEKTASPPTTSLIAANTQSELLLYFEEKDIVTATKRSTVLRKAPAIATIISAEEIRDMGARNLLDVLKMVPGFGVSTNEFGIHMVEVRGIRTALNEKILVMVDGHAQNKTLTGSALYNLSDLLPTEHIKQIEVVRGPGSALYGSNAFVATMNVITRDADEINGLEVKAGGGSFDTYKGNITGGKLFSQKLSIAGSIDHIKTNGANLTVHADSLTPTPPSLAPGKPDLRFRQTNAFLKVGYGDLSFRGGYSNRKKNTYVGLAYALVNPEAYDKTDTFWGELAFAFGIAEGASANIKLKYDHYHQDPYARILPRGAYGIYPDGMVGRPLAKDRTLGAEMQFDWDIFKGNHLILGIAYENMRQYDVKQLANFDPNTLAPIGPIREVANWNKNVIRTVWAAYIQDEWQIYERVNLTVGARYDTYSDVGSALNPRAGLVWNFLEKADMKLLFGTAFRTPNFNELYNINNPVQVGNPNLKPEKITTYEVGLTYRFAKWFAADMNYFYSKIRDLIVWDSSTAPAVYANAGQAKIQGIETALYGAINATANWKLHYAHQDAGDAVTGKKLPYVPANRAMASINYVASRHLNLHSSVLWTGQRPRDIGDTRPDMPAYTTVDLAATVKNIVNNMEWQLAIHNLFNKKFQDPDTSGSLNKVPGDFPREGISALLSMTYKF